MWRKQIEPTTAAALDSGQLCKIRTHAQLLLWDSPVEAGHRCAEVEAASSPRALGQVGGAVHTGAESSSSTSILGLAIPNPGQPMGSNNVTGPGFPKAHHRVVARGLGSRLWFGRRGGESVPFLHIKESTFPSKSELLALH
ncbi:hypothetical protein GH733_017319 [Mirounga leonina]|nr:hypothetical protein GH733_017319 [Mirounga leonina]